ncbi:SNF2 family N-terminal domain-containing protein [Paraphoma chrysanthemicola]|uniref:SNF2 family N-terminal domain-containing protein n=1 Tax=Paraphoma chrysanthemicola TaxID=798071 RepID=A0A8K0R004_9PLEO|nr:SNF2 family N-terminal domain-containing protein [Paraphoma chrysanthemicola]
MFYSDDRKRPSPDALDQGVRLKKPYQQTYGNNLDIRNLDIRSHNQLIEPCRVDLLSPAACFTPQSPGFISNAYAPYLVNSLHVGKSPLALLDGDFSDDSTLQPHPWSETSEEFPDEDLLLEDEDVVPRVCFGVLNVPVTSASKGDELDEPIPIDLEELGEMVKIKRQACGKYAGLIRLSVLGKLLRDGAVQTSATLIKTTPDTSESIEKKSPTLWHSYTARIVLAGLKQDQIRVGKLLSDSHQFLQHPYVEECGELEYCNPHYLVRPGASMPKLQGTTSFVSASAKPFGSLTELNKSRVLRIFDRDGLGGDERSHFHDSISPRVKSDLKQHQITAVAMMLARESSDITSCVFPSIWETTKSTNASKMFRNKVTGIYSGSPTRLNGGVLADDMGLGKTLSTLALICSSLDYGNEDASLPTLVVTTKSTIPGWQSQIDKHVHYGQLRTAIYHGLNRHLLAPRFNEHDVILTTYDTLRLDRVAEGPLYRHEWRRLVLDEAHHIRNRASQTFQAACSIKSSYRWCLTGTPIHNSLDDYGALLSFLDVPGFNERSMFERWIAKPIKENKSEGYTMLQTLVRSTCLRRTKESIGDSLRLPQRHEKIEYVYLSREDQVLYDFFKEKGASLASGPKASHATVTQPDNDKRGGIICLLNFLRSICNHGEQLLPKAALRIWHTRDRSMVTRGEVTMRDNHGDSPKFSAKVLALLSNLLTAHTPTNDICENYIPAKSVVFSHSTRMLDLIQSALLHYQFRTCRIDGSTSLEGRSNVLREFSEDAHCAVMLATIGSAGEGLDLTAANHVHIIEPHWNPMAEAQAVDRIYRIGQKREVFVTRYIVPKSIETYIQWVQQQKLKLVSTFADTEGVTQADIDTERWKQLRANLGCQL